jgi:hypothetical protein
LLAPGYFRSWARPGPSIETNRDKERTQGREERFSERKALREERFSEKKVLREEMSSERSEPGVRESLHARARSS